MIGPLYGQENLAAFYAACFASRSSGASVPVHVSGDSKPTYPSSYAMDKALKDGARGQPLGVTMISSAGQNSYQWAHTDVQNFLQGYTASKLLIVDYGTNEFYANATGGAQTIDQAKANHLSAISLIRATLPASSLSILLLGQLPCNNYTIGSTTENMALVNAMLKDVAAQTNCAFFDPLELFARAHSEAGWMEQLPSPQYGGGNVHPGAPMNMVLMGELGQRLFPMEYVCQYGMMSKNGWFPWASLPEYMPRATLQGGVVTVQGLLAPGTTSAGTVLCTLPAGLCPKTNQFYRVSTSNTGGSSVELQVLRSGDIRIADTFSSYYVSLDGISFRVD